MPQLASSDLDVFPGALSPGDVQQYWEQGYLALGGILSTQEVQQARDAISELVERTCGRDDLQLKGSFWLFPGTKFGIQFEPGYVPDHQEQDLELKVRKLMWFEEQHPTFSQLAHQHPGINAVLQSLLGPHPQLFQDMALIKPPFIGSEKPWHQDDAYFAVAPLDAVCGVWIALDDATVHNGCMHVIPGGHREGPRRHYHGRDCQIVEDRVDESLAVPVELPAGGAMFFHGLLPHQTPPNQSPHRRRALQFHYRSSSSTLLPREEYDRLFVEADGTPASCAAAR